MARRGNAPGREGIGCGNVESETDDGENTMYGGGSPGCWRVHACWPVGQFCESVDVLLLTEMGWF